VQSQPLTRMVGDVTRKPPYQFAGQVSRRNTGMPLLCVPLLAWHYCNTLPCMPNVFQIVPVAEFTKNIDALLILQLNFIDKQHSLFKLFIIDSSVVH